jgi:hypothetical protein
MSAILFRMMRTREESSAMFCNYVQTKKKNTLKVHKIKKHSIKRSQPATTKENSHGRFYKFAELHKCEKVRIRCLATQKNIENSLNY